MHNDSKYVPPALRGGDSRPDYNDEKPGSSPGFRGNSGNYGGRGYDNKRGGGGGGGGGMMNSNNRWQPDNGNERGYPQNSGYNTARDSRGNFGGFNNFGGGRGGGYGGGRDGGYGGGNLYRGNDSRNQFRVNSMGFHGDELPNKKLEEELFDLKDSQTAGINFDKVN